MGVVIRYLMKISGYSRQQLTRLIARYRKTGRLQRRQRTVSGFRRKYTQQDIHRLSAMGKVNGPEGDREAAWGMSAMTLPAGRSSRNSVNGPVRSSARPNMPHWHQSR